MQAKLIRNLRVRPNELRGAIAGPTGVPGHALSKHAFTNEMAADVINSAERKFIGINENGRVVSVFVKDGKVVITDGTDPTKVITAYGKGGITKARGGRIKPGRTVDPAQWANNPSYHEVH